jgi:hypothetical protein
LNLERRTCPKFYDEAAHPIKIQQFGQTGVQQRAIADIAYNSIL